MHCHSIVRKLLKNTEKTYPPTALNHCQDLFTLESTWSVEKETMKYLIWIKGNGFSEKGYTELLLNSNSKVFICHIFIEDLVLRVEGSGRLCLLVIICVFKLLFYQSVSCGAWERQLFKRKLFNAGKHLYTLYWILYIWYRFGGVSHIHTLYLRARAYSVCACACVWNVPEAIPLFQ